MLNRYRKNTAQKTRGDDSIVQNYAISESIFLNLIIAGNLYFISSGTCGISKSRGILIEKFDTFTVTVNGVPLFPKIRTAAVYRKSQKFVP